MRPKVLLRDTGAELESDDMEVRDVRRPSVLERFLTTHMVSTKGTLESARRRPALPTSFLRGERNGDAGAVQ